MRYEDTPLINVSALVRRAGATPYHGQLVISQLETTGEIQPVKTGTRRHLLTPRDGEVLFSKLVEGA